MALPSPTDVPQSVTPPPQRTRIDWGLAEAFFIGLGQGKRTYLKVAREFGVSEVTVRKWARRLDWPGKAAKADAAIAEKALRDAVRTIEQRNARTIELTEALRDRAIEKLDEVDPNVAVRALPRYLTLEQLLAGEATSRPELELGEVQAIVMAVFTVAGRFVPAERREEFLRELDAAVGGLAVLDGGKAAA